MAILSVPYVTVLLNLVMMTMIQRMPTAHAQHQESEESGFLFPQNEARATVGVPPLSWDYNLTSYAASYAASQADQCEALVHSRGPFGENLFWGGFGRAWKPEDAVGLWLAERSYYDYASNSCATGRMCGHYTQIVWRDTTDVGCATQTCSTGSLLMICNYNPPGNYIGEWPF
ncbi:hypothetical protein KP509_20G042000 [Ceratopteris richardii]|uniref:SCP domain-containing protein n=1 Tax=Ceratopteris richardii TaxID=49495 RepID=A0A8T2SGH3_CERRI|nr:hypothetical protein KP509_20G042000 [Ceratopteris richardii]